MLNAASPCRISLVNILLIVFVAHAGRDPLGPSSRRTRRWRETDSNHRFLGEFRRDVGSPWRGGRRRPLPRLAADSTLEGSGFELLVPREIEYGRGRRLAALRVALRPHVGPGHRRSATSSRLQTSYPAPSRFTTGRRSRLRDRLLASGCSARLRVARSSKWAASRIRKHPLSRLRGHRFSVDGGNCACVDLH
jgi:hypothetical protein